MSSSLNFLILKINGIDVSQLPHEDAVRIFLKVDEPILVEVRRQSIAGETNPLRDKDSKLEKSCHCYCTVTENGDGRLIGACGTVDPLINLYHQIGPDSAAVITDSQQEEQQQHEQQETEVENRIRRKLLSTSGSMQTNFPISDQDIDIEEITLRKSHSDEKLGFTVSYSSGNASVASSLSVGVDAPYDNDEDGTDGLLFDVAEDENDQVDDKINGGVDGEADDGDDDDDDEDEDDDDDDDDDENCADLCVSDILPDSLAARDGRLREGDQILQINGCDVSSIEDTERIFSETKNSITLLVSRYLYTDDEFMDSAIYSDGTLKDLTNRQTSTSSNTNTATTTTSISCCDCSSSVGMGGGGGSSDGGPSSTAATKVVGSGEHTASSTISIKSSLVSESRHYDDDVNDDRSSGCVCEETTTTMTASSGVGAAAKQTTQQPQHFNIRAQLESVSKEISLLNSQISNMKLGQQTTPIMLSTINGDQQISHSDEQQQPRKTMPNEEFDKNLTVKYQKLKKFPKLPLPLPPKSSEAPEMLLLRRKQQSIDEHIYETIPEDSETDSYYCSPYESKEQNRIEQWLKTQTTEAVMASGGHHRATAHQAQTNSAAGSSALGSWTRIQHYRNSSSGDDYENSSSAYNTGGSCNSSNRLTFELAKNGADDDKYQSSSTLVFRPFEHFDGETVRETCQLCKRHRKEKPTSSLPQTAGNKSSTSPKKKGTMIVSRHLTQQQTQQQRNELQEQKRKAFRKSFVRQNSVPQPSKNSRFIGQRRKQQQHVQHNNNSAKRPAINYVAPSLSQYQFVGSSQLPPMHTSTTMISKTTISSENHQHLPEQATNYLQQQLQQQQQKQQQQQQQQQQQTQPAMAWKVKRRPDGSRYIVRRPVSKVYQSSTIETISTAGVASAVTCNSSIMGVETVGGGGSTTTEDETVTDVKITRNSNWPKEERGKKRMRKHQQLSLEMIDGDQQHWLL